MAVKFSWTCPYCNRDTTIIDSNYSSNSFFFDDGNKDGILGILTQAITCPNEQCKEYMIRAYLYKAKRYPHGTDIMGEPIMSWPLNVNRH